jgi:3-oxoacyl-[acyl-carrier protein] reductase
VGAGASVLPLHESFVGAGYHVIAVARRNSKGVIATSTEAESNRCGALDFVPFDLGKIDEIPEFVRGLRSEFGPVFGLVNNAALGLDGALQ